MSRADEIMGLNDLSDTDQEIHDSSDEEQGRTEQFAQGFKRESPSSDSEMEDGEPDADDRGDSTDGNDKLAQDLPVKPMSEEDNKNRLKEIKKSGVIYLSSIPPYMKPVKVRQILSRFGDIGRVYLAPEDSVTYARRIKSGGNKRQKFTEGWVEFRKKSDAKLAVETMNGKPIGGKKRSFYYDDILNMKYLPKFKWHDLTEQFALEAQERQEKMKAEILQAKRENRIFMDNVERKATIERKKKRAAEGGGTADVEEERTHTYSQRPVKQAKKTRRTSAKDTDGGAELTNVLSKVF